MIPPVVRAPVGQAACRDRHAQRHREPARSRRPGPQRDDRARRLDQRRGRVVLGEEPPRNRRRLPWPAPSPGRCRRCSRHRRAAASRWPAPCSRRRSPSTSDGGRIQPERGGEHDPVGALALVPLVAASSAPRPAARIPAATRPSCDSTRSAEGPFVGTSVDIVDAPPWRTSVRSPIELWSTPWASTSAVKRTPVSFDTSSDSVAPPVPPVIGRTHARLFTGHRDRRADPAPVAAPRSKPTATRPLRGDHLRAHDRLSERTDLLRADRQRDGRTRLAP